jgi:hypothetical protein
MRGYMDATADNMTGFTGVLVGRRWKPGQKYIQLVFETTEGFKLSLSRNLRMVRSLSMGNTYRVEGREYVLGEKVVIKEPSATLVESNRSFFGQNKILISAVIAVTITGISGGVLLAKQGSSGSNKSNAQTVKNQAQQNSQNSKSADTTPAETSPQPGSTGDNQTPATPAAAPATSKKTTNNSTTSISSQPPAQPITDPAPLPASTTDQQPTDPLPGTPPPTPPPDPSPPPDPAPAPDSGTTDPTAGG